MTTFRRGSTIIANKELYFPCCGCRYDVGTPFTVVGKFNDSLLIEPKSAEDGHVNYGRGFVLVNPSSEFVAAKTATVSAVVDGATVSDTVFIPKSFTGDDSDREALELVRNCVHEQAVYQVRDAEKWTLSLK